LAATDRFIAATASWEAFFTKASALPASAPGSAPDKGKVFERLTQLYLRTHPEYQTWLRHVWRARDELPPAVRARIGLPWTDEGIDLVAHICAKPVRKSGLLPSRLASLADCLGIFLPLHIMRIQSAVGGVWATGWAPAG
jgi:hypothetical protein